MRNFTTFFDNTIPTWQELGTQAFVAALIGMTLAIVLYLGVTTCF